MAISLVVNGSARTIDAPSEKPLLWVLRDDLQLTGTKYGCGLAQCGACTVMIDGRAQRSCVIRVGAIEGAQVTTIEGLEGPEAEAVRSAWIEHEVAQCGYCQSGQVVTATAFLSQNPEPSDDAIVGAISANLCRCATYLRIRSAVRAASDRLEG